MGAQRTTFTAAHLPVFGALGGTRTPNLLIRRRLKNLPRRPHRLRDVSKKLVGAHTARASLDKPELGGTR
jgi:hypothetical protein